MPHSRTAVLLASLLCFPLVATSSPVWSWTSEDPSPWDHGSIELAMTPAAMETPADTAGAPVTSSPDPAPRDSTTKPESARSPSPPARSEYRLPTTGERFGDWAMNAFGPSAMAGCVVTGAWGHWVSYEPPEWSHDRVGFWKRVGVAEATTAITETSFSVLSAATRQDARYYRCPRTGLRPRIAHAIRMTYMARGPDGNMVFSVAKVTSPFVGPLVTRTTLYPARYTVGDGALSGAYALLMNAGWNLAYEFVLNARRW